MESVNLWGIRTVTASYRPLFYLMHNLFKWHWNFYWVIFWYMNKLLRVKCLLSVIIIFCELWKACVQVKVLLIVSKFFVFYLLNNFFHGNFNFVWNFFLDEFLHNFFYWNVHDFFNGVRLLFDDCFHVIMMMMMVMML